MLGGSARSYTLQKKLKKKKKNVQANVGFSGSSGNSIGSSKETTFFHAWNAMLLLTDLSISIRKKINKIWIIIIILYKQKGRKKP